jgi:hypothetical protein
MRHVFAATRCEGEDVNHEESRAHHSLHGAPDSPRGRGRECVGSSSRRETTRPARVAMPERASGVRKSVAGWP